MLLWATGRLSSSSFCIPLKNPIFIVIELLGHKEHTTFCFTNKNLFSSQCIISCGWWYLGMIIAFHCLNIILVLFFCFIIILLYLLSNYVSTLWPCRCYENPIQFLTHQIHFPRSKFFFQALGFDSFFKVTISINNFC